MRYTDPTRTYRYTRMYAGAHTSPQLSCITQIKHMLICLFWLFSCFFVLLCVLSWQYMHGGTWSPPTPLPFHWMLVSSLIPPCQSFPPLMIVTINHCLIIYGSVCLCFSFGTRPCILLHPSEFILTHLSPPLPFLCPSTHMSILGDFLDNKWTEIIPWWPIFLCMVSHFVLFSCVLVLLHPPSPFTPVHTRPHPHVP